ncbi:hypothetical protein VTO42DRAFT_7157 [Malbranchea cinnamomea]
MQTQLVASNSQSTTSDIALKMISQNLESYLHLRQYESGERPGDSEAEVALACLPKETPVYRYESVSQMEGAAHTVRDGGYCVFVDVPQRVVTRDREAVRIGRISYYSESKVLIARMPSEPHEVATGWLNDAIHDSLGEMGMRFRTYLVSKGSALVEYKEPDLSLRPRNLPPGRSGKWPTLVVETGYTESHRRLDNDARWWIQKSNGRVKVVITVKVSRTKVTIKRYGRLGRTRASILQIVTMARRGQQPIHITGSPLRIPFHDVFLREPVGNQGDFVYTQSELDEWANLIWEHY